MDFLSYFVDWIKEYLARENLTVNAFSKKVGVSDSAIAKWLAGEGYPSAACAVKIADACDCSIDYLFGRSANSEYNKAAARDSFYSRFDALCKQKRMTHYQIAKECELGESMISKWKRGKTPKIETLILLADYFSCSLDYLLGRSA